MDLIDALKTVAALQEQLPALQEALRERATQQAVDGGAAVAVRPWSFRHPLKGESDPWFGLAYHEWLGLRNEGFRGFYTAGDPESGRAKLMIIFDEAANFLRERAAAQAERVVDRSASTAGLRQAKMGRAAS
jgi:hypothetical protein